MSALDYPPGIGLVGTPLATFAAPRRSRRLAGIALIVVVVLLVITWKLVARQWWRWYASTQAVLPVAFALFALVAYGVRTAKLSITRDGVRWGWTSLGFSQPKDAIVLAHVYRDGVALEAKRGSRWFLAARDWDRFDVLVRQLRRAELPVKEYAGTAPLRQRLQSYGRFLDALVAGSVLGGIVVALWAA